MDFVEDCGRLAVLAYSPSNREVTCVSNPSLGFELNDACRLGSLIGGRVLAHAPFLSVFSKLWARRPMSVRSNGFIVVDRLFSKTGGSGAARGGERISRWGSSATGADI